MRAIFRRCWATRRCTEKIFIVTLTISQIGSYTHYYHKRCPWYGVGPSPFRAPAQAAGTPCGRQAELCLGRRCFGCIFCSLHVSPGCVSSPAFFFLASRSWCLDSGIHPRRIHKQVETGYRNAHNTTLIGALNRLSCGKRFTSCAGQRCCGHRQDRRLRAVSFLPKLLYPFTPAGFSRGALF